MNRHKTSAAIFVFFLIFGFAAIVAGAGPNRSIVVRLKASESPNAPVAQTVKLYDASYALVIGIDDYTNGWPRLSSAVDDAKRVAGELKKKGFEVTFLKNLKSRELQDAFEKFFVFKGADPDARLFAWFAGHGHTMDGEGYIVPADAPRPENKGEFKYRALSLRRFGELVRQAESKHALAVFDSCFSGTVFSMGRAMPPPAVTRATTFPVREFISSGDANQQVSDDGRFRKLFIRALNGDEPADANHDGYLTGTELGMFLTDRMTNLTNKAQTPRYGKLRDENYDRGDFVFLLASSAAQVEVPSAVPRETSLSVTSNIPSALVYMDGHGIGPVPIHEKTVTPGTHRIQVRKQGYEPYRTTVTVRSGRHVALQAWLEREVPAAGNLYVDTRPSDARVRILNIGPPYSRGMALASGRYHVEVSRDGYETKELWITVSAGEDKYATIALQKNVAETFRLPTAQAAGNKIVNSLGMEFVYIKSGSLWMGSPPDEFGRDSDELRHRVTLTKSFYIQTTEVTVSQWRRFVDSAGYITEAERGGGAYGYIDGTWKEDIRIYWGNPGFRQTDDHPVTCVSYNDVKKFIQWLNNTEGTDKYRLPTEAEWEYAARGRGGAEKYAGGDDINAVAWYWGNSNKHAHRVGMKTPNGLGIYDMSGNVWEWCADWYGDYQPGSVTDPVGPSSGSDRVLRGGCWLNLEARCRLASRGRCTPDYRVSNLGFRLVRTP